MSINSPVENIDVLMDYDDDPNQEFNFASELKMDEKINSSSSSSSNSSNISSNSSNSNSDSDSDSDNTTVTSLSSNKEFPYLDLLVTDRPDEFHERTSSDPTSNNSNSEEEKNEKKTKIPGHNDETKLESCQEKYAESFSKNHVPSDQMNDNNCQIDNDHLHTSMTSLFRNKMRKMTNRSSVTAKDIKEDDLKQLILSNQWQEVSTLLRNIQKQNKRTTFYFQFKCNDSCTSSHGLLHYACRFNNIPYSIVKRILKLCPDEVYEMDCSNRNALHIAVECGLSVDIIAMLINKNALAAQQACSIGNTPLHWAILSYKYTQNIVQEENDRTKNSSDTSISYYIKLFKLLAKAAPNTIKEKNCIGDTPFEIVLRDRNTHTNALLNIFWRADTSSTKKSSVKQYGSLQIERIKNSSGDIMFKYKTVVTPNPYSS